MDGPYRGNRRRRVDQHYAVATAPVIDQPQHIAGPPDDRHLRRDASEQKPCD